MMDYKLFESMIGLSNSSMNGLSNSFKQAGIALEDYILALFRAIIISAAHSINKSAKALNEFSNSINKSAEALSEISKLK
jgi:hypothetical protein